MRVVILGILSFLSLLAWSGKRVVENIQFEINCEGYMKRAADANTVELAIKEMETAIAYCDDKNLTSGYTSIFYRTPDEDIGFWYRNMTASLAELKAVDLASASQLEKSNVLMKLRETLLDVGEHTSVTVPCGISIFPSNTIYLVWFAISAIIFTICSFIKAEI